MNSTVVRERIKNKLMSVTVLDTPSGLRTELAVKD